MIVASDGLWDIVSGQQAFELVEKCSNAHTMAKVQPRHTCYWLIFMLARSDPKALLDAALADPKCVDNVSICVCVL